MSERRNNHSKERNDLTARAATVRMRKERVAKDDGRYIIFYSFPEGEEPDERPSAGEDGRNGSGRAGRPG